MIELRTLSLLREYAAVEKLLDSSGIRLAEGLDMLYGAYADDILLGCAGRRGNVIECAAVAPEARGEGVLNTLVTALLTDIRELDFAGAFVFTKPSAAKQFASLGFYVLSAVPEAVLLYSRRDGLSRWLNALPAAGATGGRRGAIVMHANPFTNGHRRLIEQALRDCDELTVFVLETEASQFPFTDRLSLTQLGTRDLANVTVCAGGPFIISRATFPSYFLKRASDASRVHAALDATLFAAHIAPALSIACRYAGSEPLDPLTAQYNDALTQILPQYGVGVRIFERMSVSGAPVSASRVRYLYAESRFNELRPLVPDATYQYLQERKEHEQ